MPELVMSILVLALLIVHSKDIVRMGTRKLALLAMLIAFASLGRCLLAAIPSAKPTSFIIILAGLSMGPAAGLVCGVLTTIVSNLLISVGPFLFWQAFAWGAMGYIAGYMPRVKWYLLAPYGFVWGFLFGWFTNLWWYSAMNIPLVWSSFLLACANSFTFDLLHAVTNAVLLLAFSRGGLQVLRKFM